MGFLGLGEPLNWEDSKKYIQYVKEHGIKQFINLFNKYVSHDRQGFLYGDEIEYTFIYLNEETKEVKLSLSFRQLMEKYHPDKGLSGFSTDDADFKPEYADWMIEGTPSLPYGNNTIDLLNIESNMKYRRDYIESLLPTNYRLFSIVVYPLLGIENFTIPPTTINGPISMSNYIGDECITGHPRFKTLTQNIRTRRGSKVDIKIPIYKDINTPKEMEYIDMDCMAFGMGSCSLQVTFLAQTYEESRKLYDQITVMAPIVGALSASGPIWRGYLSDIDNRWDVISQSVDDRTIGERTGINLLPGEQYIKKSRYDSVSCYIGGNEDAEKNNKKDLEYNKEVYEMLINNGIDNLLSKHISHLYIRDPLVIFDDRIELNDDESTEHFENIQSTNWQSARWKPPPPNSTVNGFRVELRTADVQLTDYENASYTIFSVLLNRAIVFFDINLYIPMEYVEENMRRSVKRDAIINEKFYFKKYLVPSFSKECVTKEQYDEFEEMNLLTILLGGEHECSIGLLGLIRAYLICIGCDQLTISNIEKYLDLIEGRAGKKILTGAKWIRNFVTNHPNYKNDSKVDETITFDLLKKISDIQNNKIVDNELLGDYKIEIEQGKPRLLRGSSFEIPEPHEPCCKCMKQIKKVVIEHKLRYGK